MGISFDRYLYYLSPRIKNRVCDVTSCSTGHKISLQKEVCFLLLFKIPQLVPFSEPKYIVYSLISCSFNLLQATAVS